ncbi:host specificity factor TipJ family phage tail protein [Rhodoferax sp.]|uniref:host specificity factor TipJ family phage tail protein n=1 Tax=Rhodoferax sp. TaxID=50421 RepID=UPI0027670650|nr:host specificity factor TipJ family phage tail protein [Rhodoferax sp.]
MSGMPAVQAAPGTSLVVTPHPITLQGQRVYHAEAALLLPGDYLSDVLARHEVVPGQQWVVCLGGVEVLEEHWHRIKPKHGHLIEARRVPEKQVLQIVALVALAYFTFGAGGMAGGGFLGLTGATGYVAAGAAYLAGSMVINKLLGPKPIAAKPPAALANNTNSPSYSLQAGKNRARQFEPMGLMLGEPYCVPDLAAQPYTFFANGEQYLWQLFHFGINCADVNTLRIGQTPIENYVGVQLMRKGFTVGDTGLPILTTNVDTVPGGLLEAPGGPGPWTTRTSSTNTIMLAVDIEASLYAVDGASGAYVYKETVVAVEYRLVGSGVWLNFPLTGTPHVTLGNASTKPYRLTLQRQVEPGQYEVRLQKYTADANGNGALNTVNWQNLKSFQVDNAGYPGQARMALQLQATGQLNGAVDELNARGVAKSMPYWNGGAWTTATTRANGLSNPGAQILMLARGIYDEADRLIAGLGLPDDEIDIEGLKLFMVFCAAHNFTFDLFLQENMSIGDLIESIAAAGLGSRSEHTGKLGVIWFSDDQPVEAALNMTTMKAKSFSLDYNTQETADEIEFQYFDRARNNTWKSVRVLAPGVVVPQRTARQPLQGVTDEAHAAVLARFSMGQNVYHRKTVSCDVDLEHMTFRRGTVMALSHDLTQWGYGGRVQAAVNNAGLLTLTLDDLVPAVSPLGAVSRYIGLRIPGEAQYRIFPVDAFVGSTQTVTLSTAWPGGVAVPGDSADNPAHDTIWIYDFKATPGQKLRVSDLSPQGNMDGAKVQLVPESAEFWDYVWWGAYSAPANGSLIGQGIPVVTRALVTEQLARQGNTYYTELTVTYDVNGRLDHVELWGAVDGGLLQRLGSSFTQSISWRGGVAETWTLEVRPYGATRVGTAYQLTYSVIGLATNPETPIGVALTQESVFCQPTEYAVDVIGFLVRTTTGVVAATAATFLRGTKAHEGYVAGFPWRFTTRLYGVQTVMVVSEDSSGNWSDVAYASLDFGQPANDNIGQSFDYRAAGWPGTHADCSILVGDLVSDADPASDLNTLLDWNGEPDLNLTQLLPLVYEAQPFVTLYGGGTLVLDIETEGPQSTVEYRINGSTTNDLNTMTDWNTEADLNGPSGGWQPWPGALMLQRGLSYALQISIEGGTQQPMVKKLLAKLALQKVTQTFPAMAIAAGGTRLSPADGTPAVTWVTVQSVTMLPEADGSGAVGGRFLDLSPTLGPLVQQVNSSGVAVASRTLPTVGGLIDA